MKKIILILLVLSQAFSSNEKSSEIGSMFSNNTITYNTPNPDAHRFALKLQGAIIISGIYFWNYSDRWTGEFAIENEGWFRKDSYNGGADKLGHIYVWSLLSRALISHYERNGFSKRASAFWGFTFPAVNGLLIELLDGYTSYNASTEDIISNMLGSGLGIFLYLNPKLDETFSLNWSYLPSSDFRRKVKTDFTTDYAGQVFTLDMNGYGLRKILGYDRSLPSDYFQIGLSYYSRGYSGESGTHKQRMMGVSLGVNFQQFFEKGSSTRTFLKYFKIPYSFLGNYKDLNSDKEVLINGKEIFNY